MKNRFNTKIWLEAVVINIITVLLAVAGYFMPAIIFFTIFLSAISVVVLTMRTGMKVTLLSLPVLFGIIFLIIGQPVAAGVMILSFYPAGIVLGYGFKQRWDFRTIFIADSGAYLLSLLTTIVIYNLIENVNQIDKLILQPLKRNLGQLRQSMLDIIHMYHELGVDISGAGSIDRLLNSIQDAISILIPAFFIVISAAFAFITLALSKRIAERMGYSCKHLPAFYELKADKNTVAVFIISFLLCIVIDNRIISSVLLNITFILSIALLVCGLAVLDYFVYRAGIPGILRAVIYALLFVMLAVFSMIFPMLHPANLLMLIALGDSIFDFR